MNRPEHHDVRPVDAEPPAPESDDARREADEDFWQWVALVVLLACWMAEACM